MGLVLLLLTAASAAHSGNAQQEVDRGTFTLFLAGARIGEERFVIRRDGGSGADAIYRAGAELNLKLNGQTRRVSVALESTGPRARPRRYEAQLNGSDATTILVSRVRDRIRLDVQSPRGDEMREYLARERTWIADRNVAHHYFFAWRMLGGEGTQVAHLLVPQDRIQGAVTIVDRGEEPTIVNGRELRLRHVEISGAGGPRHAWLNGDRVIKVEVPQDAFLAVRSDGVLKPVN